MTEMSFRFFEKAILDWRTSREYFYWRLKRRLGEDQIIKTILHIEPSINHESAMNYLQQWFNEDNPNQVNLIVLFLIRMKTIFPSECRMVNR